MKSHHDRFYKRVLPRHRAHSEFDTYLKLAKARLDELLFGQSFTLRAERIDPARVRVKLFSDTEWKIQVYDSGPVGHKLGHNTPGESQQQP